MLEIIKSSYFFTSKLFSLINEEQKLKLKKKNS